MARGGPSGRNPSGRAVATSSAAVSAALVIGTRGASGRASGSQTRWGGPDLRPGLRGGATVTAYDV
eukprot:8639329-Alexandrium_andersonii.AAC.1